MSITSMFQIILSSLFFISAISKIFDFKELMSTVKMIGIFKGQSKILSISVIMFEIASSLFLLFKETAKLGSLVLLLLLFIFILISLYTKFVLQKNIKCNCFGSLSEENIGVKTIIRNIIFLIFVTIVLFNNPTDILTLDYLNVILVVMTAIGCFYSTTLFTQFYKFLKE
ncbi:MauE/DoxX family redox-associated membrane protein [Paenibacillus alvei]|uniref:Putative Methylamine utilization protein MauE n=1 Tax=Paenibacillus alvei TaxID=44250 RepID=A0A383REX5_PAEAL|nr:MauE/DoxX family redox-associated membrane protein [Paenibacillus alvei]SYX84826.1 putative Methylamine utilization protein MauE [Paenibacillus alvei]